MAQPKIRDEILDTEPMKKVFIGGIPNEATDEDFKAYMVEQAGEISECNVIRKDGNKGKLFAFLTLATSEAVDELLLKKTELKFQGAVLGPKRSLPKDMMDANQKTKKMFVNKLPSKGLTEEDLKTYLEERHPTEYGTIESIEFIKKKDSDNKPTDELKGFGFVTVSSEDMADKMAVQHAKFELNGSTLEMKKSVPPKDASMRGRGRGGAWSRGGGRGGYAQQSYDGYGYMGYGGGYQQQGWGPYGGGYGGYYPY